MSDDAARSGNELTEQFVELIERGQDAILDAVRQWTEAGARMMPDLPNPPISDLMPDPKDVVAGQFDLAERLLATQRHFAEQLLQAMRPPSGTSSS
jgi:hypothetical protein